MIATCTRIAVIVVVLLVSMPRATLARPVNQSSTALDAAQSAVAYSLLENQGAFAELYLHMHSDARRLIPASAVIGWYQNDFAPRGPGVISVTGVRMVSWTWEVTGTTYPYTAEVSFTQPFANGVTTSDVVRLVQDQGEWRWFFGRSRAFVDEQIARYSAGESLPSARAVPAASGAVTVQHLLSAPFHSDELPAGYTYGGIWQTYAGETDGPLFGSSSGDFGAAWINVSVGPGTGSGFLTTTLLQYAVFGSPASASSVFHDPSFVARFQGWAFGSQVLHGAAGPESSLPALFYWDPAEVGGPGLGPTSATAGVVLLVGNVIVIAEVIHSGFANMAGAQPSVSVAGNEAVQLANGSALHIMRLSGSS